MNILSWLHTTFYTVSPTFKKDLMFLEPDSAAESVIVKMKLE